MRFAEQVELAVGEPVDRCVARGIVRAAFREVDAAAREKRADALAAGLACDQELVFASAVEGDELAAATVGPSEQVAVERVCPGLCVRRRAGGEDAVEVEDAGAHRSGQAQLLSCQPLSAEPAEQRAGHVVIAGKSLEQCQDLAPFVHEVAAALPGLGLAEGIAAAAERALGCVECGPPPGHNRLEVEPLLRRNCGVGGRRLNALCGIARRSDGGVGVYVGPGRRLGPLAIDCRAHSRSMGEGSRPCIPGLTE